MAAESRSGDDEGSNLDLAPDEQQERRSELTAAASQSFIWSFAGMIALQLAGFATFVVAARVLDPDQLGVAAQVLAVTFWLDVVLDLGMGANIIFDQEKGATHRVQVAFTVTTSMAVVIAAVMFFTAPLIAGFFGIPEDVNLFRWLSVVALARGFAQAPDSMLRRDLNFKVITYVTTLRAALRFGLTVLFLALGMGAASLVISIVVSSIVTVVLLTWIVRFRPVFVMDWPIAREMLRYGMAIFGARLIGMLWHNGDYLVVGRKRSSEDFADYWVAFRLPELLLGSIYNIFSSVLFPTYSAARDLGAEAIKRAYLRSIRLLWLYGAAVAVGLAVVARDFITVFFSKNLGAIAPMEILSMAGALVALGFASGDLYNAMGKPKLGLYFGLGGVPFLMAGFILVVDRGITAVALVHLIILLPYTVLRLWVADRIIGTNWRQTLGALRGGFGAAVGIAAFALPVRFAMEAGLASMLAVIAAGAVGGFVGILLTDRGSFREIIDLLMKGLRHR